MKPLESHHWGISLGHLAQACIRPLFILVLGITTLLTITTGHAQTAGALDATFGNAGVTTLSLPTHSLEACDSAIAADGSVWMLATASNADSLTTRALVAKFTSTGALDTTFGPGGYTFVPLAYNFRPRSLALLPDGSLRIAGQSDISFVVVGLTAAGKRDPQFGLEGVARTPLGLNASVRAMKAQSDGKLLLAGCIDNVNATTGASTGKTSLRLLRLQSNGLLDSTFGVNGIVSHGDGTDSRCGNCIAFDDKGDILVGGLASPGATVNGLVLRCSRTNGALDTTFDADGILVISGLGSIVSLAPHPGNGCNLLASATSGITIARVLASGALDTIFSADGKHSFTKGSTSDVPSTLLLRRADGRLFIGSTITGPSAPAFNLLRMRPDAALDPSFDIDGSVQTSVGLGSNNVAGLMAQVDGKLILFGTALTTSATMSGTGIAMARYEPGAVESTITPPLITTQPASQSVATSSPASFNVVATGSPAPTFQWLRNGSPITNATSATLSFSSAQYADEGSYSVVVSNAYGSIVSDTVTLAIASPLTVVTPPANIETPGGTDVTFNVTVSGRPPFTYQWQRNQENILWPITGPANTNSISLVAANLTQGNYRVVVSNSEGSVTSPEATLSLTGGAPNIFDQPEAASFSANPTPWTLIVRASGALPMTIQWQKDGANFGDPYSSDQGSAELQLDVSKPGSARYRCVITNSAGSATSDEVRVTAEVPGTVTLAPVDQVMSVGEELQLTSSMNWTLPALRYQWWRDGKKLTDNLDTFYRVAAAITDGGTYQCMIGTIAGTVSASTHVVVVESAPRYVSSAAGKTATMTVKTGGPGITSYRWLKDDAPLSNGGRISGADKATLNITVSNALADTGIYTCAVTAYGTTVTSGPISLYVEGAKPVVTPFSLSSGRVLRPYSASVSASAHPMSFSITGLPPGLTYDAASGNIQGAPTAPGTFTVKVTATNPVGTSLVVSAPLVIDPLPVQGTYSGLVYGSSVWGGMNPSTLGTFSMTVAANGSYTGKAVVGVYNGALYTLPFSGAFTEDTVTDDDFVSTSLPIAVPAVFENGPYTVDLHLPPGSVTLEASLNSSADDHFTITPHKNYWSASRLATDYAGYYTASLSVGAPGTSLNDIDGTGYTSISVTNLGTFTMGCKLPDNTALTLSGFIDELGEGFVFQWLNAYKGSFGGEVDFTLGTDPLHIDNAVSGDLQWTRPPGVSRTGQTLDNAYFAGLYDETVILAGGRYLAPNISGHGPYMLDASAGPDNITTTISDGALKYSLQTFQADDNAVGSGSSVGTLGTNHVARYPAWFAGDAETPKDPMAFGATSFTAASGIFSGAATAYEDVPRYDEFGDVIGYTTYGLGISYQGIVVRDPATGSEQGFGFFVHTIPVKFYDFDSGALLETINLMFSGSASISVGF